MSTMPLDFHQPVSAETRRPFGNEHSLSSATAVPPLDPEAAPQVADADTDRLRDYLRRKLAEGHMNPSRERLMRAELQRLERLAA